MDEVDYAVDESFVDPTSGLDLTVSVNPSRVGGNQLRVELRGPTTGDVTGLTSGSCRRPAPSYGYRATDPADPTRCRRVADGYLPFAVAGAWTMQVSATTPTGSLSDSQAPSTC